MKSLGLLVLLSISIPFLVRAQDTKPLQYGVIAGLNLTDLYTADAVSNMNSGFNTGGFVRVALTNCIAIEPELYVSTKGSSVIYNSALLDGTANFNFTYLEMPVVAVFNMNRLVNLQIGSYLSCLMNAQVKNVSNVSLFNFEQNLNVDNFNRVDAGIVVGVGLDVRSVTMGMRYNLGLIKVGKSQTILGASYNIPDAVNGVVNFYLAVGFNQNNRKIQVIN